VAIEENKGPDALTDVERAELQAVLDAAGKALQPAGSRDEGLKLLRKLQYWIGASPVWWGRPLPEFGDSSPWDYILEGGDPEYLLEVVRTRHPLE
jgi:hypothetical protein